MTKGTSRKKQEPEAVKKAMKREGTEMKVEEKAEEQAKQEAKQVKQQSEEKLAQWKPKTELGKLVKQGKITNIDEVFEKGYKILEPEIVDALLPNLEYDLILIGQAKGKFGGGKRRAWRQTQKKTAEGNVPKFAALAVVGDRNGHVGIGYGKAKETLPAREKAIRKAKLNIFKVNRGCGSFDCICNDPHSIPAKTEGKEGSVRIILMPAPRGTGLVIEDECKKIMRLAGIKDIYSRTFGKTRTKFNLIKACIKALKKLNDLHL